MSKKDWVVMILLSPLAWVVYIIGWVLGFCVGPFVVGFDDGEDYEKSLAEKLYK